MVDHQGEPVIDHCRHHLIRFSDVKEHVAVTNTSNDSTPMQQGSFHSAMFLWMTY